MTEIVTSVLQKVAGFVISEAARLYEVSNLIAPMQRELGLIQSSLEVARSKRKKDPVLKQWLHEVRNVVFRIEDVLDIFLVEVEENHPSDSGVSSNVKRVVKHPLILDKLDGDIKEITETLKTLYQRKADLQIDIRDSGKEEEISLPFRPTKLSHIIPDSEIVGFDTAEEHIITQLLNQNISRRTVHSIIGIGGLGKTTLAKKVYKSKKLNDEFKCRSWVSISNNFKLTNILREILYSVEPESKKRDPPVPDEDLEEKVQESLYNKNYLIVLDDVWTEELWERIKFVLPDNKNGSRVLLTSRDRDIAIAADCNTTPYELHCLEKDDSLALLFQKAFQEHIEPENYPPNLCRVAESLAKKCHGLPLALVVLGGILSKRGRTLNAWERVEQSIDWQGDKTKNCMNVLALSYDNLPSQLQPCFLYFASFPEDYEILAKHITRMWIAEGFIPNGGNGTLESRAEEFLEDLKNRCLVQVVQKSWNGSCRSCRVHDLVRELAISESKENNFFTVFSKEKDGKQLANKETRRVAIQFHTPTRYDPLSAITRSVLCFGKYGLNHRNLKLIRVLVIQDINFSKIEVDNVLLEGLVHIKYLGFRNCRGLSRKFLEISFDRLENLETFDCKNTIIDGINHSLWKVPNLRHVIAHLRSKIDSPSNWDDLRDLQTLKWVRLSDITPEFGRNLNSPTPKVNKKQKENPPTKNVIEKQKETSLTKKMCCLWACCFPKKKEVGLVDNNKDPKQVEEGLMDITPNSEGDLELRTLKIFSDECRSDANVEEAWKKLKALLSRSKHLVSLGMENHMGFFIPFLTDGTRGLPCHETIRSLHLKGKWARESCVPSVEMFPPYLTKLVLAYCEIRDDPMPILENLQCLESLNLGKHSYMQYKMFCSTEKFPSLQKLIVEELRFLSEWEIEEGAMPNLKQLTIIYCERLYTLPNLQYLRNLQELVIVDPHAHLQRNMQSEDLHKIENIAKRRIEYEGRDKHFRFYKD